jgi:type II secretory pathway component PulK
MMASLRRLLPSLRRRATVLIIVMWIAACLVAVALYFGNTIGLEYRAADNTLAGLQAEQAVKGARRYVDYVMKNLEEPGIPPSLLDGDYVAEEVPVGPATFWLLGRDTDGETDPSTPVYGLVDEASKLNLNTATVEMLEALPGMDFDLAAAIVDWRDADQELTPNGAESQDYLALEVPYNAKDAEFESPEELRWVKDMNLTLLYGEDVNRNGLLDPNEDDGDATWPADNSNGHLDAGLIEYVTTFTREPNVRADGQPRINLTGNTAQGDLTELLNQQLNPDRASQIMSLVQPTLDDTESILEFFVNSQMTAEEFRLIEGDLTVSGGDYLVGLVNVATAPAAVLASLPNMTETMAEELAGARRGKTEEELHSVAWVASVLDPTTAVDIGPYITGRSYQYSADVVAVGHDGRGFRRELMVFDVEDGPRVIYRRDLTRFGWPLGETVRTDLTEAANRNR